MIQRTERRLIEKWIPINEISVETIRERSAVSALPPVNWLHVWWARRPLVACRAAVAASVLSYNADASSFHNLIGTHQGLVSEQDRLDEAKLMGVKIKDAYSQKRAFLHNITTKERDWMEGNLPVKNPVILDITAGGGSIPFEASRLGFTTIANELNPVASLILRATCEWPQKYGFELLNNYQEISKKFLQQVLQHTEELYPNRTETLEPENPEKQGKREIQTYLFARTVECPDCQGVIPLSPTWRLDSKGNGIKLIPNLSSRTCAFQKVSKTSDCSPATKPSKVQRATCPYPDCGATTPNGYLPKEATAGRMGHQLYCIIYRDSWHPRTKSGRPAKKPKTERGFRIATPEDDNLDLTAQALLELKEWEMSNIIPNEDVQLGDKTKTLIDYGMPKWRDTFNSRQLLAHGYCTQAFRELVDEECAKGTLTDCRKAAWSYVALAIDKVVNRNSLLSRWNSTKETVEATFDSHDFGMKWSYAEMAITIQGLGLEWALNDLSDCIKQILQLTGQSINSQSTTQLMPERESSYQHALPSKILTGPAQDTNLPTASVDTIIFDPPYHRNVNYAELSDFFYVWLKRTAGYVLQDNIFSQHLTDKVNEAIASPARFNEESKIKNKSTEFLATLDYKNKMKEIFQECRRVIKSDGIMTVMFTHKDTDAWDALTVALIDAGFGITRTWPIKTESDQAMNIKDRAAARSTILLVCRPRSANPEPQPWHVVENKIAQAVREDIKTLQTYGLSPVDQYLASFGPALQVISENWGTERAMSNPHRPSDEFSVTPTDALEVARREVMNHRTRAISERWAETPGDPITRFYILAQDGTGASTIPFDEANLFARAIGVNLTSNEVKRILISKGDKITLKSARDRFAENIISPQRPAQTALDQYGHPYGAWLTMQHHNPQGAEFRGTLEALLRVMRPGHEDWRPAIAPQQRTAPQQRISGDCCMTMHPRYSS